MFINILVLFVFNLIIKQHHLIKRPLVYKPGRSRSYK